MIFVVLSCASLSGFVGGLAAWAYTERVQSHWPYTIASAVLWVISAAFTIASYKP